MDDRENVVTLHDSDPRNNTVVTEQLTVKSGHCDRFVRGCTELWNGRRVDDGFDGLLMGVEKKSGSAE